MSIQNEAENEKIDNDLVSYLEEKLGHLKPYWSHIALGICVAILGVLAAVYMWQRSYTREAEKWLSLSNAQTNYRLNLDNRSLTDFAEQFPDDKAGMWALLFAGDAEMRGGLTDFMTDREAGFDKIEKAQKLYKRVVDSTAEKSTELQRRSVYALAYAYESTGDFDNAAKLYKQLADVTENNPFAEPATRGLARSTNPEMAELFKKFREHRDVAAEEAPGAPLPKRPDISLPDDSPDQTDAGGGDFSVNSNGDNASNTESESQSDQTDDANSSATESNSAELPASPQDGDESPDVE